MSTSRSATGPGRSPGRVLYSVGIVATTLLASVFVFQNVWGLLIASEVPFLAQQAVLVSSGITLALSQPTMASALGRRAGAEVVEHTVVDVALLVATGFMLVLTAMGVR